MRKLDGEQVLMRIFIGESDKWKRRPLSSALLKQFRTKHLAGATVLRVVAGFGPRSILHTAGILKLSADLPLIIEVVDSQEHIDAVLPEVDRMMSGGLIGRRSFGPVERQKICAPGAPARSSITAWRDGGAGATR